MFTDKAWAKNEVICINTKNTKIISLFKNKSF